MRAAAPGALVAVALAALACGAARREPAGEAAAPPASAPAPVAAPSPAPAGDTSIAARARRLYDEAQRAMLGEQDIDLGVARLEEIVALDPDFGEAWYQLGTARLTQAAVARAVDTQAALGFFRQGTRACRRASELIVRGSLRVWDAFELRGAQEELERDLAAIGPESGLVDDGAALAALDRWAAAQGYDQPEGRGTTPADER